jgi:hypothetical protein
VSSRLAHAKRHAFKRMSSVVVKALDWVAMLDRTECEY